MAGEGAMLRGMLVEIGFGVDKPSQQKAVQAHAATQKQITKDDKKGSADRLKSEVDEWNKRRELQKKELKRAADARDQYFQKWRVGLVGTAEVAAKTAASIAAVSSGIVFAVDRAAKSLERLNYLSGRAKSSPSKLTAFGYAASQTGSSQEEGDAFLEQFGQRLNYPGYRQALKNQIGNIYGPNGKLLDSATLATRLGQRLARVRQSQGVLRAQAQGSVFGLEGTSPLFNSVTSGPFAGYESSREAQQAAIGANPNAAAAAATPFEQSMRRLESVVDDIGTKIEQSLATNLKPALDKLSDWATQNGAKIADFVTTVAKGIVDLTTAFANNPTVQSAFGTIGKSLSDFADIVSKEDFKKDVKDFVADVIALAKAIRSGLELIGVIPTNTKPAVVPPVVGELEAGPGGTMSEAQIAASSGRGGSGGASLRDHIGRARDGRMGVAGKVDGGMDARGMEAMRYLVEEKGWTPAGAAIAVGNAQQESGIRADGAPGDGGISQHMFQWNHERLARLDAFAAARGKDPNDFHTNLDFMDEERKHRSSFERNWHKETDLRNAADIFHAYEGYGDNSTGTRMANAALWLRKYGDRKRTQQLTRPVQLMDQTPKASPFGGLDRGAFSIPPPGQTVTNSSADNSRGDTTINANQTFNITGGDPAAGLSAAKLSAGRGQQDLLRRMQGAVQ